MPRPRRAPIRHVYRNSPKRLDLPKGQVTLQGSADGVPRRR